MQNKAFVSVYWQQILLALLAIVVFCFWYFLYPFIPVTREMSQLFLWNSDYLTERIVLPGGFAKYLAELIVQFFLNPFNGALIYAVLFLLAQFLSSRLLRQFFPSLKDTYRFALSLIPPVILWRVAMIPHIPLTPTVDVLLVLGVLTMAMNITSKWPVKGRIVILCLLIPVCYWLAWPASVLDYDWSGEKQMGTNEEMECDMLMRMREWEQIVGRFHDPESPAVESAVLLALYQTGQMSRQELYKRIYVPSGSQSWPSVFNVGGKHLIVNFGSLSSAFMVSDIALQLDMPNVSQRVAFEAMEYIPNYNKSVRSIKRLTETAMITGQYQLAKKYLSILEETLFYRRWAQSIRPLVEQPELMNKKPYYQQLKKAYATSEDIFFI